jgi:hypothetical protein
MAFPHDGRKMKKGETLNPNGRPKKIPKLDDLLADVLGDEKDGIDAAKAILMALRSKAIKGDVRAAEVLLDRAYGKAKQYIDNTHEFKNAPTYDEFLKDLKTPDAK